MRIDLNLVRQVAEMLAPYRDDEELFLDTLDGETDALDIIDRELAAELQDRALADAIAAQVEILRKRAARISERADTRRLAILRVMQAVDVRKMERPLATISRRDGSVSVRITDADAVPTQLCKIVKSPDKAAIRKQIEAGETVPGAELARGEETLSVRVA